MKTKILFFLFLFVIFPFSVSATTVTPKITCEKSNIQKNEILKCSVKADIKDGTLSSFSANVDASSTYFTSGNQSVDVSDLSLTGNDKTIAAFTITAGDKNGSATINLSSFSGKDDMNEDVKFDTGSASYPVRILNDVALLNDIKIDGESVSGFSASGKVYNFSVSRKTIEITTSRSTTDSLVSGDGKVDLKCGDNKVEIKVKAEDGSSNLYTLNVTRTCSDVSTLKGIALSSGTLSPKFDKDTKSYNVSVSKDIDKITLTPIKENEGQEVKGSVGEQKLNFGKNTFKIEVVSEKDTTTTYTIVVTREDSRDGNCYLKSLVLSNGKIMFDKDQFEYVTKVLYETKEIDITAVPEKTTSKVEIKNNKNLKLGENLVTVTVTSENDETRDYVIKVIRLKAGESLGVNANIASLDISGYKLNFDSETLEYLLEIKNEKTLDLVVTLEDETSVYEIVGNENLENKSVIKVIVEALDGTVKTYKINIKKTDNTVPIVIAILSIVIAVVLIIFVLVSNKKGNKGINKDKKVNNKKEKKVKPANKVKNNVSSDKDKKLLDKVNKQLNLISEEENNEELNQYVSDAVIEEVVIKEVEEKHSDTKICSLCGHKLPYDTGICPYCKKKF